MIILNYVFCIPVILAVGGFRYESKRSFLLLTIHFNIDSSLYHLCGLIDNTTTIENWEKDKVSVMIRKGKIRQIAFPYVSTHGNNIIFNLSNYIRTLG